MPHAGCWRTAEVGPLDELQRARLDLLRAEAAYSESRGSDAPALLLRAAKTPRAARPAARARDLSRRMERGAVRRAACERRQPARRLPRSAARPQPAGPQRPSDLLLDGFSLAFTEGRAAAAPVLEQAATGFAGEGVSVEEVLRWGWLATAAAVMVWDYETCLAVATRGVELAREAGALAVLAVSVNVLAQAVALGGDSGSAASLIAEADSVTEATGAQVAPYGALCSPAFRAARPRPRPLIDATIDDATAGGQGTAVQYARWARSVLLNGLGRYQEALTAAQDASDDTPELFVSVWALIELIEAATRSEDMARASGALDRLAEATVPLKPTGRWGSRRVPGAAERRRDRRAPVSGGDRAAGPHPATPGARARSSALRRVAAPREPPRRRARQLRTAHELLDAIGMEAFAERARSELLATGEKVRKRTVETRDELTAQERQIAQLARDGLSNPEIGARLFLSPRTVEWHLRKVFAKLGIRSRRELAMRCPAPTRWRRPLRRRASDRSGVGHRLDHAPPERRSRSLSVLSPSASSRADCSRWRGRPSISKKSARAGGNSLSAGNVTWST